MGNLRIKIDKDDKELFLRFKNTKFPLGDNDLCEEMYFYLLGYITQVLSFRSKGICVYGYSKIELQSEVICEFIRQAENNAAAFEYLELAKETAKRLNKYITRIEDPAYMKVMRNYGFMRKTLRDVPFFHDAEILECEEIGNDVIITFILGTSEFISPENRRIYKLNPKYRYQQNDRYDYKNRPRNCIAVKIKFVNTELLKGSFDKEYVTNGLAFLWDLEYETVSDTKHKFDLFTFDGYDLTFNCEYIEFVETK
jgi:hypothetical protein